MKKGEEIKYVEYEEFLERTQEKKLIYILPDVEFIEGITKGKTSYFITIHYHNSSGADIEVHPEAWKEILKRIEAGDDNKLWKLLHSWDIYRG